MGRSKYNIYIEFIFCRNPTRATVGELVKMETQVAQIKNIDFHLLLSAYSLNFPSCHIFNQEEQLAEGTESYDLFNPKGDTVELNCFFLACYSYSPLDIILII